MSLELNLEVPLGGFKVPTVAFNIKLVIASNGNLMPLKWAFVLVNSSSRICLYSLTIPWLAAVGHNCS